MKRETERAHTGQYVNVAVLAFVVRVIGAVGCDAHVDCTRLNLLKHTRTNSRWVNTAMQQSGILDSLKWY